MDLGKAAAADVDDDEAGHAEPGPDPPLPLHPVEISSVWEPISLSGGGSRGLGALVAPPDYSLCFQGF